MKVKKYMQEIFPGFRVASYLVIENKHALLIDTGGITDEMKEDLSALTLDAILLTHGHWDHIYRMDEFDVPVYMYTLEFPFLTNHDLNGSTKWNIKVPKKEVFSLEEFKEWQGIKLKLHHTPGHTKGSVCIQLNEHIFTGDMLFMTTVGRTDLMSGNVAEMQRSIEYVKKHFSNNAIIYPGHGGYGKMKRAKELNPFLK